MKYNTGNTLKSYLESQLEFLYKELTNTLGRTFLSAEEENDVRVIRSKIEVLETITKICKERGRY